MSVWTNDELEKIAAAEELQLASLRRDGTLRKPVTIWLVRLGDDLYVRPVGGQGSAWFRSTQDRHEGQIHAGGVEKNVTFLEADDASNDQIDDVYSAKYSRYPKSYVDSVISTQARAATIKLAPRIANS